MMRQAHRGHRVGWADVPCRRWACSQEREALGPVATPSSLHLLVVDRPVLSRGRAVLGSLGLQRGDFRLQFCDGLVLALRLILELAQKLQDFADQVLRPSGRVQYSYYSLIARQTRPSPRCRSVPQLHAV